MPIAPYARLRLIVGWNVTGFVRLRRVRLLASCAATVVTVALSAATQTTAAQSQPSDTPPTSPPPTVSGAPTFVRTPSASDVESAYSQNAKSQGTSGSATLQCAIGQSGQLLQCAVVAETPANQGFGAAALSLAPKFLMSTSSSTGSPTAGMVIRIPTQFNAATQSKAPPLTEAAFLENRGTPLTPDQSKWLASLKVLDYRPWYLMAANGQLRATFYTRGNPVNVADHAYPQIITRNEFYSVQPGGTGVRSTLTSGIYDCGGNRAMFLSTQFFSGSNLSNFVHAERGTTWLTNPQANGAPVLGWRAACTVESNVKLPEIGGGAPSEPSRATVPIEADKPPIEPPSTVTSKPPPATAKALPAGTPPSPPMKRPAKNPVEPVAGARPNTVAPATPDRTPTPQHQPERTAPPATVASSVSCRILRNGTTLYSGTCSLSKTNKTGSFRMSPSDKSKNHSGDDGWGLNIDKSGAAVAISFGGAHATETAIGPVTKIGVDCWTTIGTGSSFKICVH